jgi:hypothetical protein
MFDGFDLKKERIVSFRQSKDLLENTVGMMGKLIVRALFCVAAYRKRKLLNAFFENSAHQLLDLFRDARGSIPSSTKASTLNDRSSTLNSQPITDEHLDLRLTDDGHTSRHVSHD